MLYSISATVRSLYETRRPGYGGRNSPFLSMAWVLASLLRGAAMIRIRPEVSGLLKARDASAVLAALQFALELEHATIPPYLYAMWSLGTSSTNSAAARIIRSVVNEEMRHLATVANIINALGGTPVFDSPSVLPHYPGPLPGAVEEGLSVGLAPSSRDLVEKTFMVIEQPEHPLEFPALAAAADEPMTIGQFYRAIRATIDGLGDSAFTGPPGNQVTPDMVSGVVAVTNVATRCLCRPRSRPRRFRSCPCPDAGARTAARPPRRSARVRSARTSSARPGRPRTPH